MTPAATIGIICILIFCAISLTIFIKFPKEKQIESVREWLKWAVVQAEKALGSGTGQLKLRYVYNLAVKQYPWISETVSFEIFSKMVDNALVWMNLQIESNKFLKEYIMGEV